MIGSNPQDLQSKIVTDAFRPVLLGPNAAHLEDVAYPEWFITEDSRYWTLDRFVHRHPSGAAIIDDLKWGETLVHCRAIYKERRPPVD